MTSVEEGDTAAEDVPVGNPEEVAKNPTALKEAHEQMATLDMLVCGQCHSAFHFVEEFSEHKEATNCTGKSPVRDSNESKAQVWAFLLWKCSSARDGSIINSDNSWKLYQQWCRMAEAQRTAWITAGSNVQALSKFAHAKVMELKGDDQLVPIQTPQSEVKKRGRPRKTPKVDEDYHPSGEESDEFVKPVASKVTHSAKSFKESNESVRNAQERVPPEERIARRTDRLGDSTETSQFVVEKILAKRFNPRRKQYEYLLKWEGYPQRPRTRGPRRGRGVRVRGGQGRPGGLPVVEAGGGAGVALDRGGSSGRRGGRVSRATRHESPGPRSIDELTILDIDELPKGQGLETALHPKRMRIWRPSMEAGTSGSTGLLTWPPPLPSSSLHSVPIPAISMEAGTSGSVASLTPSSPPPLPSSPSIHSVPIPAISMEAGTSGSVASPTPSSPRPLPSSPSLHSVPSPAMFEEWISEAWEFAPSPAPASPSPAPASPSPAPASPSPLASPMRHLSPRPPRRHLRTEDIIALINYGSEEDSEESDDEGALISGIPRVFRSLLETPLDQDDDTPAADPEPAAELTSAEVPPTATDQPWSLYDFEWKEFSESQIPAELRRETFSQINVGPTTPRDDPYDIFIDIWDRQIMEHIASETNRYAQQLADQMFRNDCLYPASRIARWTDVTSDELYSYFGIVLAMGMVVKTRVEEYWSSAPDIFYTPGFSAHMSIDRFLLISKCLHFSNNDDMCALELGTSEAKLYKIEPIVSHLKTKFEELYTPAQNIALDESLLMWKGWLEMSQLIPNKAAKRGIKTYEICESQTGYLWRFEIHAHKKTTAPQHNEDPLAASTPSIVLRLIKGLENKGYTLWMDNFYNSPCLARRLKCLGVDCVGTLRTDRKFIPQALHQLTKRSMRPGQITGLTSGDVDVMVWRDANRVAMISTYHGNHRQTLRGSTKPTLILDYNIMMGGVDKKDQLLAMYPVERKRSKVWYKKLFKRLLNISVLNSYIIYRHSSPITHRNFRLKLIKSLLAKHSSSAVPSLPPAPSQNITHHLREYGLLPSGTQHKRRLCVVCKKKIKTFCDGCKKTVCLPCFPALHS